jgi:cobalt-zinc-cadmium resistance protein CzcA
VEKRLLFIVPLTVLLIFIILYTMFRSLKWASLILLNVMLARIGGLLALVATHTNFTVSSGVGFLALFGVPVQTRVIMLEYITQRRARGASIEESAIEGAVLRLRPIMMTMLVATLAAAGRAVARNRVGLAEAVRDCDCRRVDFGSGDEYFPAADLICVDGSG